MQFLDQFIFYRHLAEIVVAVRERLLQIPRERRVRFWHHTALELYHYLAYRKL